MSRNNIVIAFVAAAFVLVAMCVGFSAAIPLVRSTPNHQDRVYDFTISENKDSASWTAFGRQWNVRLELSDVVEDNTDYFHGTLEGDESAVVSFALLPGSSLSGMIATGNSTWWIRAMPVAENNHSEEEEALGHFMIREQDILHDSLAPFSAPLEADIDHDAVEAEGGQKRAVTSYKLAVYFDQNWAKSSNPWASQANTIGLFNDVNAIYKAAGLGTWSVVYGKQITNSQSSLNGMLTYFANTASASISAFTDRSYTSYMWLLGTNIGGLTYVGTACQGTSTSQKQKTGVAGLVSWSRLWTVKVIAHELGHNRGAVHDFTNQCSGATTRGCQCSLMSYCYPTASNNPSGAVNFLSASSIAKMKSVGCY